jgi:hypothetical protein
MGTSKQSMASTDERSSRWAQRLVHPASAETEPVKPPMAWIPEAIEGLWSMLDEAVEQANTTLARLDVPRRIVAEKDENEWRFTYTAADGSERWISIFLVMPPGGGTGCGSGYLSTSQSRAFIYLMPALEKGRPVWRIEAAEMPFGVDMVHDLFLSVFGDDPVATLHLSPLGGHDLFHLPWS